MWSRVKDILFVAVVLILSGMGYYLGSWLGLPPPVFPGY